ncbi:MAG: hypothetical protein AAFN93_03150 [Bacteroidota bacterium]
MKSILTVLLALISFVVLAQKEIKEEYSLNGITEVSIKFKYPELVSLKTWDGDKVVIKGTASINLGKNDENFIIKADRSSKSLYIDSQIKDMDELPHKLWATEEDGTIHVFNAKDWNSPEVQKYLDEHPKHRSMSHGVIKKIQLEVLVPKNVALNIDCKFGLLEIQDFDAPLFASSKFAGIDISVPSRSKIDITAKTKFGEIYTDLDADFDDRNGRRTEPNRWLAIQAKLNGGGKSFVLESEHGDLYLRKK